MKRLTALRERITNAVEGYKQKRANAAATREALAQEHAAEAVRRRQAENARREEEELGRRKKENRARIILHVLLASLTLAGLTLIVYGYQEDRHDLMILGASPFAGYVFLMALRELIFDVIVGIVAGTIRGGCGLIFEGILLAMFGALCAGIFS